MFRTNPDSLTHWVGVGESKHELAVVFVGPVADHIVLGCTMDVSEALLQRVGCKHGRTSTKSERLGNNV